MDNMNYAGMSDWQTLMIECDDNEELLIALDQRTFDYQPIYDYTDDAPLT